MGVHVNLMVTKKNHARKEKPPRLDGVCLVKLFPLQCREAGICLQLGAEAKKRENLYSSTIAEILTSHRHLKTTNVTTMNSAEEPLQKPDIVPREKRTTSPPVGLHNVTAGRKICRCFWTDTAYSATLCYCCFDIAAFGDFSLEISTLALIVY